MSGLRARLARHGAAIIQRIGLHEEMDAVEDKPKAVDMPMAVVCEPLDAAYVMGEEFVPKDDC
eukprot:13441181-Alexandrium_andersonii.AAC.1